MLALHEYEGESHDRMKNRSHKENIDEEISHVPMLEQEPPQDSIKEKENEEKIDEEIHQVQGKEQENPHESIKEQYFDESYHVEEKFHK
jgi:hypothetical protein